MEEMKMMRIRLSQEIVEMFMEEGNEIRHTIISKGIPPGSVLVNVTYDAFTRSVDFYFRTKGEGDPINEGAVINGLPIRLLEATTPPPKCTCGPGECP